MLISGAIEPKSNFIEHPELIVQRTARYARFAAMAEVVRIALRQLWN